MEQKSILSDYVSIKYALNLIKYSQTIDTLILFLALGFIAFQVFRSSKGKSNLLSLISKNFGFLNLSLGISPMVLFFFICIGCLRLNNPWIGFNLYSMAIFMPLYHFKIQPSNINEPIVDEINPVILIMWSISIILALFICVKAYLNFQKINEVKISKMLLFIPISLNIFVLSLFVCIFGDFFKIDFIKKISFFSLAEKSEIRNATSGFFYFSIFCMTFIFSYLNKNISPSRNNASIQGPVDENNAREGSTVNENDQLSGKLAKKAELFGKIAKERAELRKIHEKLKVNSPSDTASASNGTEES